MRYLWYNLFIAQNKKTVQRRRKCRRYPVMVWKYENRISPIRQTLEIYRSAVCYLTEIYEQVWEELAEIPDAKRRFNAAEHLVHTTKKNPARFDFDLRFPKMPSYLRRAAIQHALGSVSSYETRMDLWEKSGEKVGKPRLAYENHAMPVFLS